MNVEHLIAKRYLFSKKSISLISSLTWISIAGITIGTALLIIVLSVFNGFYDLIKQLLLSNDPHIRIEHTHERFFGNYTALIPEELKEDIVSIEYFVEGNCLVTRAGRKDYVTRVKGVSLPLNEDLYPVVSGVADLNVRNKVPGVLISESLAQELRLYQDDTISLLSADGIRRSLTQFGGPRTLGFQINGTVSLREIVSEPLAIVDIRAAQRLFYLQDEVSGIDIRFKNEEMANHYKPLFEKALGDSFTIKTWYDLQKTLYDVMSMEKWASYAILMIIVLVAILNIVGSLTMIVIQKKKDIGILMAMGLSESRIRQTFRRQGFLIGLIGCGIGGSAGILISLVQEHFGLVKLAGSESFIIDAYPIAVEWFDVGFIIISCLMLCVMAAWFPANKASTTQVADALRYE
ncbi:ABC transporter permease [bacterium]|nr:MAG: ABC transporter permease [bacterium]